MEEEGKWEESIRLKIYDFEADTDPEGWEILSGKLKDGKIVRFNFYRKLTFAASAAAVIALLIVGGLYLFSDKDNTSDIKAVVEDSFEQNTREVVKNTENVTVQDEIPIDKVVEKPVNNQLVVAGKQEKKIQVFVPATNDEPPIVLLPLLVDVNDPVQISDNEMAVQPVVEVTPEKMLEALLSENQAPASSTLDTKRRRWSFGMGGGGYAVNSTTGGTSVMPASRVLSEDEYMHNIALRNGVQNSTLFDPIDGLDNNLLGKVNHQAPLSAGLGVSYNLTDHWALQSGVVYTLLRSKGTYMDEASNIGERKRNLHFFGIPLSMTYRIAEWKGINFYASAGGMGEWNFAGKQKEIMIVENLETIEMEKVRMNELLWSLHTRAGAVYPLWKYVNVYAEAGVSYYFDNNSPIETVRSEKPLNISIQAGVRLGF